VALTEIFLQVRQQDSLYADNFSAECRFVYESLDWRAAIGSNATRQFDTVMSFLQPSLPLSSDPKPLAYSPSLPADCLEVPPVGGLEPIDAYHVGMRSRWSTPKYQFLGLQVGSRP